MPMKSTFLTFWPRSFSDCSTWSRISPEERFLLKGTVPEAQNLHPHLQPTWVDTQMDW